MFEFLAYLLILVVFFRLLVVMGFISVDEKVGRWHHFYLGILFLLTGIFLVKYFPVWSFLWAIGVLCNLIGLCLMGDDLLQHWTQRFNPTYTSPIHRLGTPLYEFRAKLIKNHPWWQWLERF